VSYVILKSDGTVLTTIPDGTINTSSTPLGLPGRLYPGYGQVIDTDVVHLLENFADSTPPNAALKGQLWYNTANSTLCIAPSDSPSANSWVVISTVGSNASFGNLTVTGNITANNATISNSATANAITVNYATVNVSANIANANVTGNLVASNVLTNLVSTGSQLLAGNMIGTWTVSGGLDGNSLRVSDGNLYIANGGYGIKTDSYMYANGVAVSFDGTYTNSNVAAFLPVYTGEIGLIGGGANLNGDTLNTGSASNPGTIIGNWTVQAGSQLTGLSNIPGTSINSIVDSANTAIFAVNVLGTGQPNITSVGTLTSLTVSGALTTGQIISTVSNGTAPLTVLSTTKVANLNADFLDNYNSAVTATPDTVAVRDANGNISANYFVGNGSLLTGINTSVSNIINGTSNINIASPNGSIVASVNGVNNVLIIASSSVIVSGTLNATAFVGDGSGLTNLTVGNISGTIANANYAAYAGVIVNSSQPNITSVGTLTSLAVTGNISSGNVISSFLGSGAGLTNIPGGNVVGTVSSATSATTAGTVTTAAQPNITSVGTLTSLAVTGNISGANLTGSHFGSGAALTNLPAANVIGKVANAVYADIAGASGPSDTANTVTNNAQPNITSVGTLVSLTSSGNIIAANVSGNLSGNGFAISNINGSNVSGTVSLATTATTASTATTAATVTTNAQPNITSVGILSGLNVAGTVNVTGAVSATGNTSFASGTQQVRDIIEQINLVGSALTGAINVDLIGPSTNYYTVDATGNWVINFRGNSSVTANSYLATGQMSTTTLLATAGAIAYYPTAFTIDSVSVTPKWLNSAPVSGTPNKVTAYTFTIVKTGSAAYTVFASTSNYG
jgi:hypothetical protein